MNNTITDVSGILVGHAQDMEALTGCTVVICEKGATAGIDQRGGAPGTRETDALRPMHLVDSAHAILLTGGSAYGLDAAAGVMRYLEQKNIGFNTGVARVPIVASAVIFDLALGKPQVRPDASMGYNACMNATNSPVVQGNVGVGTGASIGKILGMRGAMKAGIGSASIYIGKGIYVGALMAVNAFGDVINPQNGQIIAGARSVQFGKIRIGKAGHFIDTLQTMKSFIGRNIMAFSSKHNTVIGVVATNARLTKEEVNKVAQMAHNGIARTIRPAHTMLDGDTVFALATNQRKADVSTIGAFAAEAVSQAILNAIFNASAAGGIPSINDL